VHHEPSEVWSSLRALWKHLHAQRRRRRGPNAMITFAFERPDLRPRLRNCYQIRPGSRVVTSCTIQVLPSGSLKEQKDP
jgi:hypothetical protein